ncbi:hypothetical protein ACO2J1_11825 [Leptospira interrogans]|uniref:Uncharacterized protein n=1 Tax=Leptospira interrogans serovar Pomona TaxID=44276 RepID=A0AA41BJ96_LEPIR|nr:MULTISPECIES: hypothetical protein [Leptospira]KGE23874.1 hypothetical protein IQ65_17855 [Leptospira interrogans serovar Lai]KYZ60893.1 hypothetical protein AWU66_02560 [Leptospira interrogans serovar Pomona]MBE8344325.1 hypothetical protein [Leptospira interrogans serovar Pomona]MBE8354203.1 hypothetical protein [Leptospira interrogans serovar Pomona]MBE8357833.1 hypothetical protein [Leptospira interrogans serovar Pomona]
MISAILTISVILAYIIVMRAVSRETCEKNLRGLWYLTSIGSRCVLATECFYRGNCLPSYDAVTNCERLLIGEERKYVYLQLGMPIRSGSGRTEYFDGGAMNRSELSVEFNHNRLVKKNCRFE